MPPPPRWSQPTLSLPFFIFQKPLRIDRRHAAAAGGGYRLTVDVVLHVLAGEDLQKVGLNANMRLVILKPISKDSPEGVVCFRG